MKIVYPLASLQPSRWNDIELKMSLRALWQNHITKHGIKDPELVIISEYIPPFLDKSKVHFLHVKEAPGYRKAARVAKKMYKLCKMLKEEDPNGTPDPFLYMNDDFYINDLPHPVPNYYHGDIWDFAQNVDRKYGVFKKMLIDTYHLLKSRDMPTKHFAQHLPCMIDPVKMLEVFPFEKMLARKYLSKVYSMREVYGNSTDPSTWVQMKGVKINKNPRYLPVPKHLGKWYLENEYKAWSLGDKFVSRPEGVNFLKSLWPVPSPWEK